MSKYDPLRDHLRGCGGSVVMTFDEVSDLIGGLPSSAYRYSAWWANDDTTHSNNRSWGDAGFRAAPNLDTRIVVFTRK